MRITFDFETEGIKPFPEYPPKPVGLAIKVEGTPSHYYSWGHPTNNNCVEERAKEVLSLYWNNPEVELIAHNLPFDLLIAVVHWGFDLFPKAVLHDTMVQAFLLDPHAYTYALKPLSEKLLGMPPEEQDAIREWLLANGYITKKQKDWGAHICKVPGDLVGEYACGDVDRTYRLFTESFSPSITENRMDKAYRRELDLIPIMLENTRDGICVDTPRLARDIEIYDRAIADVEALLFQYLECEPFNVDSDATLADMIDRHHPGLNWILTPKGKRSTSKVNIDITLSGIGGYLGALLQYRASMVTCVNTFMKEWYRQATTSADGRIRCQWNTTRGDGVGARTGRLSSTPNFMNIPTLESAKFKQAIELHTQFLSFLPSLPNVRCYIVADSRWHVLLDRDFSGQELRVMSHFEDGAALQAYKDNPRLDLHQWAADYINATFHLGITRKQTKTCSFAILYGSGLTTLARQMGSTYDQAAVVKAAYLDALPGLQKLMDDLKRRARNKQPFRTWGGRVYYCEPASFKDGRWRTYDYKMVNYLVQGSSADISKEALIRYHRAKKWGRIILMVHDEICISCPKKHWIEEMAILQVCMEEIELDAQLLTDGEVGYNWHELTPEKEYV